MLRIGAGAMFVTSFMMARPGTLSNRKRPTASINYAQPRYHW
jgi:hypothetical protein